MPSQSPTERALGFRAEVIDSHAYIMPRFDVPCGVVSRDEKLRRLQNELGTHHTFTLRMSSEERRFVDNSSLMHPSTRTLEDVVWGRDALGRVCWQPKKMVSGEDVVSGDDVAAIFVKVARSGVHYAGHPMVCLRVVLSRCQRTN